jgi:DHA1 family bicyclomycin/chloramphenicol resistance-like MFS transporter
VLQDLYGLSPTEFSLMFALNAAGMILLGLLNARLVRRIAVRRLLMIGLVGSSLAAVVLLIVVGTPVGASLGAIGVLLPLFVVVATRGWSRRTQPCSACSAHRPQAQLPPSWGRACSVAESWSPRCSQLAAMEPRSRCRPLLPAAR